MYTIVSFRTTVSGNSINITYFDRVEMSRSRNFCWECCHVRLFQTGMWLFVFVLPCWNGRCVTLRKMKTGLLLFSLQGWVRSIHFYLTSTLFERAVHFTKNMRPYLSAGHTWHFHRIYFKNQQSAWSPAPTALKKLRDEQQVGKDCSWVPGAVHWGAYTF